MLFSKASQQPPQTPPSQPISPTPEHACVLSPRVSSISSYAIHSLQNTPPKQLVATKEQRIDSVAELMHTYLSAWNEEKKEFILPQTMILIDLFIEKLNKHSDKFKHPDFNAKQHFGFINKFDLDSSETPKLYIRADLHGDLRSLLENLTTLKQLNYLNEDYQCQAGLHLVFLGDYCDRGRWGACILHLLMLLKEENPEQVHLLRGNHESSHINKKYCKNDLGLKSLIYSQEGREALDHFYQTMPLTTYFSIAKEGKKEYIQCTHGLFEPTMDPAPLLGTEEKKATALVPKQRVLSKRIQNIAPTSPLAPAALRLQQIVAESTALTDSLTLYNWGDVHEETVSSLGSPGKRKYLFCAEDIRHYLDVSSEQHAVELIFRGHQHAFQHLMHNEKVLVTTLPIGVDCPSYEESDQLDRAYILHPKETVAAWTKQIILRQKGHKQRELLSKTYPLLANEELFDKDFYKEIQEDNNDTTLVIKHLLKGEYEKVHVSQAAIHLLLEKAPETFYHYVTYLITTKKSTTDLIELCAVIFANPDYITFSLYLQNHLKPYNFHQQELLQACQGNHLAVPAIYNLSNYLVTQDDKEIIANHLLHLKEYEQATYLTRNTTTYITACKKLIELQCIDTLQDVLDNGDEVQSKETMQEAHLLLASLN